MVVFFSSSHISPVHFFLQSLCSSPIPIPHQTMTTSSSIEHPTAAPFDLDGAGLDRYFTSMAGSMDYAPVTGAEPNTWVVDTIDWTDDYLWLGDEMEIVAAQGVTMSMDDSVPISFLNPNASPLTDATTDSELLPDRAMVDADRMAHQGSSSSAPLADAAMGLDSPPGPAMADDTTHQGLPSYAPLADAATDSGLPPIPVMIDEAMQQESNARVSDSMSPGISPPEDTPDLQDNSDAHHTAVMGRSRVVIVIDDPEEATPGISNRVRKIVGSDILDDDVGSEYSSESDDDDL
ncbi:hypothetical protein DL98DRAFT_575761 [Cadophora sp. DSE1049]|nr:hypothetical protein DL98DRAFT_575761 [Cadophora sp. DSE1049]